MDKRTEKIMADMENNALGLDDTFRFKCRACGKCCKNRYDILLTTRDLHNIARELGRTIEYVIERYCETYIGHSSRIPIVRLRPAGPEQACPLMYNKRCIVHKAKPVVCAIFPLGRGYKMDMSENGAGKPETYKATYFFQPDTCGNRDHIHTVRSWLEEFGIPAEDEFFSLWTELTIELGEMFNNLEAAGVPESLMKHFWGAVYSAVYVSYDANKDLIPQFRENAAKLRSGLPEIAALSQKYYGGLPNGKQ
jgi:Fe-S-cluster containining protein